MTEFSGKVAFVTGAASGLGLSMAKDFASRGCKIMLADRDAEGLEAAHKALSGAGFEVASVVCDVAKVEDVQKAADATLAAFGKVHIVANNAGVALDGQPGKTPVEDWKWIVDINLLGVVYGVEVFEPIIRGQGEGGHFINTASMAGHVSSPMMAPYHATKFAVVGYSESIKAPLAASGIGVSVLCPAWVKTKIHTTGFGRPSATEPEEKERENPAFKNMEAIIEGGLDADAVAGWVSDCVEADRMYIFTHPDFAPMITARHAMVQADYQAIIDDGRFS